MTRTVSLLLLAPALVAIEASAHPLSPALLQIDETARGRYQVSWKSAADGPSPDALDPTFPGRCTTGPRTVQIDAASAAYLQHFRLDCGKEGLEDQEVGVAGSFALNPEAVLRLRTLDGRRMSAVLREHLPSFLVRPAPGRELVLRSYALGFEQVFTGDHLLFVLGLFLLAAFPLPLLRTVAAFTAAHSLTLTLSVLDIVRLPQAPVEATIAAGIALLAVGLSRPPQAEMAGTKRPWAVAFAFGLLHGSGFGGALASTGLPHGEAPAALLSFNLGVEGAQLLFIAALLGLRALAGRLHFASRRAAAWVPLAMGSLAAWACLASVARFWPSGAP